MQEKKVYCTRRASRLIPMNQDKVIWVNMKLLLIPLIWRIKDENANRQKYKNTNIHRTQTSGGFQARFNDIRWPN